MPSPLFLHHRSFTTIPSPPFLQNHTFTAVPSPPFLQNHSFTAVPSPLFLTCFFRSANDFFDVCPSDHRPPVFIRLPIRHTGEHSLSVSPSARLPIRLTVNDTEPYLPTTATQQYSRNQHKSIKTEQSQRNTLHVKPS